MHPFLTEFPVEVRSGRAAFVAEVVAWLRGISHSTVLGPNSDTELDQENAHLVAASGEEIRFRDLKGEMGWIATGFRHDLPDNEGRLWRTEGVLSRPSALGGRAVVRIRTECVARRPGARLDSAKKPYLIKALLQNAWGGIDLSAHVSDQPIWLTDDEKGLQTALDSVTGNLSIWLPTIYVSALGKSSWLLSEKEIEKLAYDLGGVAHIVVEPDRAFSFRLRDLCHGTNAYAGTVGIGIPKRGIVRRMYVGWEYQDSRELLAAIRAAAPLLRGQIPTYGLDWTELQERALRSHRELQRNRLTAEEAQSLFLEEIDNLKDRIRQLEQQIEEAPPAPFSSDDREISIRAIVSRVGPEIYSGEIFDRIRYAASIVVSLSDQIGLDTRSTVILERIADRIPRSQDLEELMNDLARATKDPKRAASELTALLCRHGFHEKSDNRHIRLEADDGFDGLGAITLAKTPSDIKGLKNTKAQIERTLGINKLSE